MKHIIIFTLSMVLILPTIGAQTTTKPKPTYLNFNFTKSKLKLEDEFSKYNDYGGAITVGRTFYLNKKPVADMIRFGLDWTFFDLNFSQYSIDDYDEYEGEFKVKTYHAEIGMHLGPSITVTPINNLNISAYFRYAPSYVGFYNEDIDQFKGTFASFFVTGISVSYSKISVGIEQRWGTAKFKFKDDYDDYDYDYDGYESTSFNLKTKTSGPRFYIGLRF